MREFSAVELKDHLERSDPPPLLLDVREPWEYETARIEGARLAPMRIVPALATELDRHQEIVVICHHGIRSRQVCRYLESQGFDNLINLSGGVDAWARDVDRLMPTY